jgi:aminoglycoside 6-adenylyltransferase
MRIEMLADHPELALTLARWHYQEWGHLDPDGSLEKWTQGIKTRMNRDRIPLSLVAFIKGEPVGSAVLVDHDMDTRQDLSPWLAGVFVRQSYRSRGVASALVKEAMRQARELGVETLYLYTRSAVGLYQKLGWKVMETTCYQGREVVIMSVRMVIDNDKDILQNLRRWGQARGEVRAMILTSTRARPGVRLDAFSDYDVILVLRDVRPFYNDRSWLEDFGRVLAVYRDPIRLERGLERFAYITQYQGGTKIDFTLWPVEMAASVAAESRLPAELDVGYQVLLDKDGLTAGLNPPTYRAYIPSPPSQEQYQELIEVFFHEATYVAKNLWRDELLPAKYSLDHVMKGVKLRRMLEWRIEIDHDWSIKTGALGKGLKAHLSPEIWKQLEATYVGASLEENWQALFEIIDLFRKVALQVGLSLGYPYPEDLHQRSVEYLHNVRDLTHPQEA